MDLRESRDPLNDILTEAVRAALTRAAEREAEEAAKRLKERAPEIVAGILIRFQRHIRFERPEEHLLKVTIDLRKEGAR